MKKGIFTVVFLIMIYLPLFALVEEEIFVEGTDSLLKYSLSNNINEIERAIQSRTGITMNLSDIGWTLNPALSISVKNLMNKHNLNYSMTTYIEGIFRYIIVNRRVGENWFFISYKVIA
jgi:hypothetical protein